MNSEFGGAIYCVSIDKRWRHLLIWWKCTNRVSDDHTIPVQFFKNNTRHDRSTNFPHLPFFLCSSTSTVVRWWISNIRLFDRHIITLQNLDVRLQVPGIHASRETCQDDDIIACDYKQCWWCTNPTVTVIYEPVSPSKQKGSYMRMTEVCNTFSRTATVQRLTISLFMIHHRFKFILITKSL